jgi:hypothetical protein
MSNYTLNSTRVSYYGGLALATPLAVDLQAPGGGVVRADYIEGSMAAFGRARYTIDGATYELQRSGQLVLIAEQKWRAA